MSSFEFTDDACWGGRPVARRIADARPRRRVVVTGTIRGTGTVSLAGSRSYSCVLADGTGEIGLLFIGRHVIPGLVGGVRCTVEGTAKMGDGRLVLWNPLYRIECCDAGTTGRGREEGRGDGGAEARHERFRGDGRGCE